MVETHYGTTASPLRADDSPITPFQFDPTKEKNSEVEAGSTAPAPVVLLIEDNSSDIYVIGRVLKQSGIPIDFRVASDGEQALAILKKSEESKEHRPPALILLDWNLPRISGAEILSYLRQRDRWKSVPVVVVTSTNSPVDVGEIRKLGATAHFRKPTDLDAYLDLKTIVRDLLMKTVPGHE